MIEVTCNYGETHTHEFPDDWLFDGADGMHWGADPRYRPTTYVYFDEKIRPIHLTQVPLCDNEAIEMLAFVARIGPDFHPVWIQATRPGAKVAETIYQKE